MIAFESTLHQMTVLKKQFDDTNETKLVDQAFELLTKAKEPLKVIYRHRNEGDKNAKWAHWYSPEIRRPNNGFPTFEMLDAIVHNLKITAKTD